MVEEGLDRNKFADERFLFPPNQDIYLIMQYTWSRLVDNLPVDEALKFIWPWWTPPNQNPEPPPIGDVWIPSEKEIRHVLGNFLAVNNFTAPAFMMPGMNPDERRNLIYNPHRERGLRSLPFGWKTYYPKFPQWTFDYSGDSSKFRDLLQEINRERFVRIVMVPIEAGDSFDTHINRIRPYLQAIHNDYEYLGWGWEINDINDWTRDGDYQLRYIEKLVDITRGEKRIAAHWTPERWSGWPNFGDPNDSRGEIDWLYQAYNKGLSAVFYQEPYDKPIADVIDRTFTYDKKNYDGPGICGRVQTADLDFVFFEHSRDENRWNELAAYTKQDGRSQGIC